MDIMKLQLKWAFRVEHLGSGFYKSLAARYRKDEALSQVLDKFSKDEHRHAILFQKGYKEAYGETLTDGPWNWIGKALAVSQILLPLKFKLKMLSVIETLALNLLNKELTSETENQYRTVLSKIKNDEVAHAGYFLLRYPNKVS